MTATLLDGSPATFRTLCQKIGGIHAQDGDKAKCIRGMSTLVISFSGDRVDFAAAAYPSTPKDVRSLRAKAIELFGEPDVTKKNELTWQLKEHLMASVSHDDEHSMFSLGRVAKEQKSGSPSEDRYKSMLDVLARRLDATGRDFADGCKGRRKDYPGKAEFAGHRFYSCIYIDQHLGLVQDFLDVGPRGVVQSASSSISAEHTQRLVASILDFAGEPTKTVFEPGVADTWVWRFEDALLTVNAYRNVGDTVAEFRRVAPSKSASARRTP